MKSRCLVILLSIVCAVGAGCFHRTKTNTAIAADVEETFKQRWIAKRMGELQASGVSDGREARRQATEEFRQKYEFIGASKTPDPIAGRP
ncbi:hypothetical protein DB347_04510 [Opitutaceae bacterium EW11]|nr:hypothetical protein DB347_04510 [Opitutaceae bacterium EW11]